MIYILTFYRCSVISVRDITTNFAWVWTQKPLKRPRTRAGIATCANEPISGGTSELNNVKDTIVIT